MKKMQKKIEEIELSNEINVNQNENKDLLLDVKDTNNEKEQDKDDTNLIKKMILIKIINLNKNLVVFCLDFVFIISSIIIFILTNVVIHLHKKLFHLAMM